MTTRWCYCRVAGSICWLQYRKSNPLVRCSTTVYAMRLCVRARQSPGASSRPMYVHVMLDARLEESMPNFCVLRAMDSPWDSGLVPRGVSLRSPSVCAHSIRFRPRFDVITDLRPAFLLSEAAPPKKHDAINRLFVPLDHARGPPRISRAIVARHRRTPRSHCCSVFAATHTRYSVKTMVKTSQTIDGRRTQGTYSPPLLLLQGR